MKNRVFKLSLFLLFYLIRYEACAQLKFGIQNIDMPEPFRRAYIRNVTRDCLGFIFFTTNQGIWRYDGTDVQAFNIPGVKLPPAPLVLQLYCYEQFILLRFKNDPDVIFCYDNFGQKLHKFRLEGILKYAEDKKLQRLMLFTKSGQTYSFSKNARLTKGFKLQWNKSLLRFKEPDEYFFDSSGRLFLLFKTSVAMVVNSSVRLVAGQNHTSIVTLPGNLKYDLSTTFVTNPFETKKYIVVRYGQGVAIYDKNTFEKKFEYYNNEEYSYTFCIRDSINIVFRGAAKNFKLPKSDCFKAFQRVDPYSAMKRVWTVSGGDYVASTNDHLYLLTSESKIANTSNLGENAMRFFAGKSIRGIYRDHDKYYVGTYNSFYVFDGKRNPSFPIVAYTISRLDDSRLLMGVEGGDGFATLSLKDNNLSFLPNQKYKRLSVSKIVKNKSGFVAAVGSSLYVLNQNAQGQWSHRLWLTDRRMGSIKDIAFINNKFWVAGEGGLFRLDGSKFSLIAVNEMNDSPVYAILQVKGGILLATLGYGIVKIDYKGKFLWKIGFKEGLGGDFAYSLYEIDGLLFSGTNGGVSVLDMKVMQVLSNPDNRYEALYNQEFNHSAIYYDAENRQVLMGGVQGLVFLDVDYYKSLVGSPSEKLILSFVKKSTNGIIASQIDLFAHVKKAISIQPNEYLVALKFSGSFKQKDMLFRIKEISLNWRKSKLFNEISLYALPPGTYTLEARFPSNTDPKYWLVKTLIVKPSFYETWIFKGMVVIVVLLVICQFWLSRIKKIRREMELRTNIASDLHDEIGSTLTRISLSSELMYARQEADQDVIQNISTESKNAIASISDIIWSVDARNDSREDLVFRMQEHVHFMLSDNADVTFETIGLERARTLPQFLRQNIYLIFKEAVNNIVKHNDRPCVWIVLNNQALSMTITIKNTIDRKPAAPYLGQGLKNMKMRAERIKASISMVNSEKYFIVTIKTKRW